MSLYFDNNDLFDADGHLTDDGLYALKDGTLDDLGALEAAEHLSFCDYCLLRYTELIDAAPACLQQPMRDLIPQVQALMHLRRFRVLTNRYVSTAAAIALAFTLWRFGAFGGFAAPARRAVPDVPQRPGFSELLGDALNTMSGGLNDLLGSLQATIQSGWAQMADPAEKPANQPAQAE